jgi:low temperature requirement protein LtrA
MNIAAIRPPSLRTVEEGERSATWLELFYDLVFVAAVAVLAGRLLRDSSWIGWLSYAAYFALVWWLWASHTFYADRYDTDDLIYRLVAATQMVAIAFIAASLSSDELAASTVAFAAAYAAARILLLVLYARAYRHVAESKELVRGYLIGFSIAAAVWVVSIFVPEPGRYWLWALAFAIDLATPFLMRRVQARVPLDVSHLPERFGLFTILVLGETIVAVTFGLGHVEWQWSTSITGAFGMLLAAGIWWLHFDNLDGFVVRRRGQKTDWRPTIWIYSHLPLAIGLAMTGVGVEHAIIAADHSHEYHLDERWVLVGGMALAFAAMTFISIASLRPESEIVGRRVVINRAVGTVVILLVGVMAFMGPVVTVGALLIICGIAILVDYLARSVNLEAAPSDEPVSSELEE